MNKRENFAVYTLATVANILISIPQYMAVSAALQWGITPKGSTYDLITQYGSSSGLVLDLVWSSIVFEVIAGILLVAVIVSASSRRGWRWQFTTASVILSVFLTYYLGGKFLNVLGWIGVLETSGVNVSGVIADLFWFGLGATVCFLLLILTLRRSYGRLLAQRARVASVR